MKAKYSYISFRWVSNYLFVIYAYIKVKLGCKIPIVAKIESTKTISDHAAMLFCADGCVPGNDNIEYICFNLQRLYFKAGFTNSDVRCPLLATKISNFLYDVQYLLFEIILRKITSSKGLNLCLHTPLPVPVIASIYDINKIIYTRLQGDVRRTFVIN